MARKKAGASRFEIDVGIPKNMGIRLKGTVDFSYYTDRTTDSDRYQLRDLRESIARQGRWAVC